MARGFASRAMPLAPEHFVTALSVLERHPCIDPGSTRFHSGHLHFTFDLSLVPDGALQCVEGVVRGEIERACSQMGAGKL